jgi:hypothetical protein
MDVFVLGAGFSKAIAPTDMPTLCELTAPLSSRLEDVFGQFRLVEELNATGDVEAFLTFLSEEQPWLTPSENALNRAAFFFVVDWMSHHIFGLQQHALGSAAPAWLLSLVQQWHTQRECVVTLNYDLLVEAAVDTLRGLHASNGQDVSRIPQHDSLPLAHLADISMRYDQSGRMFGRERRETFRLLKLHGSLNWAYSPQSTGDVRVFDTKCVDRFERSAPHLWSDTRMAMQDLEPSVIPPVTSKSPLFGNGWMKSQWVEATSALESARRVIVIGYSMPSSDVQMRLLLAPRISGKSVILVNPDTESVTHYERMLGDAVSIDNTFVGGTDCVERFVAWYLEDSA